MATVLTPASTKTEHLLAALRAARGWQRAALAEITETPVNAIVRWTARDLDALNPDHRCQVETILSTSSTQPWWHRAHA